MPDSIMMDNDPPEIFAAKPEPIPTLVRPRGTPCYPVRCILFDLYGTLFVSDSGDIGMLEATPKRLQALEVLLRDFNLPWRATDLIAAFVRTIQESHRISRNKGVEYPEVDVFVIWKSILEEKAHLTPGEIKQFASRFELTINPVSPMPGLESCLESCRKNKLVLGLISNAQFYTPLLFNWFLHKDINQLGFQPELLFFSYKYGCAKPSSLLFHQALCQLDKMGIQAKTVVYLGNDMLNDILPAQRAGFQTALFAGDKRSLRMREEHPECRNLVPDLIVTDLLQITDWF